MSEEQKFSEETRLEVLKMAVSLASQHTDNLADSLRDRRLLGGLGFPRETKDVSLPDMIKHLYDHLLGTMKP